MLNKYIKLGIVLLFITIGFAFLSVYITQTELIAVAEQTETDSVNNADNTNPPSSTIEDPLGSAEALIDETISRDDIEAAVGKCDNFEMSSNGCERGVYAGRFYYDTFIIYSRTYDMGETFHIMSVNIQ